MKRTIALGGGFLISTSGPQDVFTPEERTEEHRMIFKTANDFVRKEVHPRWDLMDNQDEATIRHLFRTAGELGLSGTDIPEEYGGLGLDKISTCLVAEAMGNAGSFAVSHGNHTAIGSLPIVFFGTEEQKQSYLPRLASGEWIGAYCLTEANAGSDALNSRTRACLAPGGDCYLLNGEKVFVTNSAWADSFIVYAKVDGEYFTGFIVERTYPGISFGPEEKKMGIKGSSTRQVIFTDCPVPVGNVLLGVGMGHKVAFNALNIGRFKMGAFVVGGGKTSIGEAVKYANRRIQFGRPISSFGLIKEKLARMTVRTYLTESLVYRLAGMIDDKIESLGPDARKVGTEMARAIEEYATECSICKVYSSEAVGFCADEWVQILGGYGYCADFPAERVYRNCRINRIFEGTNEINRLLIPGTLLKRVMQGKLALFGAAAQAGGQHAPSPLADQQDHLGRLKKVVLQAMMLAGQTYGPGLAEEQEILARLADMIIETFALESGLVRAIKLIESQSEDKAQYAVTAVKLAGSSLIPRITLWADEILARVAEGAGCDALRAVLTEYQAVERIDTVALQRFIADRVIEREAYPFG